MHVPEYTHNCFHEQDYLLLLHHILSVLLLLPSKKKHNMLFLSGALFFLFRYVVYVRRSLAALVGYNNRRHKLLLLLCGNPFSHWSIIGYAAFSSDASCVRVLGLCVRSIEETTGSNKLLWRLAPDDHTHPAAVLFAVVFVFCLMVAVFCFGGDELLFSGRSPPPPPISLRWIYFVRKKMRFGVPCIPCFGDSPPLVLTCVLLMLCTASVRVVLGVSLYLRRWQ